MGNHSYISNDPKDIHPGQSHGIFYTYFVYIMNFVASSFNNFPLLIVHHDPKTPLLAVGPISPGTNTLLTVSGIPSPM